MQLFILIILLCVVRSQGLSDLSALSEFKKGIKEDPLGHLVNSWKPDNVPESDGCPFNWYGVQCSGGRVISIMLNDMGLVGTINFSLLSGMQMLHNFSVSNNSLTGVLPPDIGSIASLEFLDLSQNSFSGSIPKELVKMGKLIYLNLSSNSFHGEMPTGLGNLKLLKYLDIHSNSLLGDISFLGQLQNVLHVDLSQNKFTASLKSLVDNSTFFSSVQYLNISNNRLLGQLFAPDMMPLFDSLEVFDAGSNQLSGQIPSFQFVVSLRVLRLGSNKFSGSLPEALLKESSMILSELDLSRNQLEGPVGSITSTTLKSLNLSANRLFGLLPVMVGHCSVVDLSNNRFSGNLSEIRSWGNYVEVINLSFNSLTGTLPNETAAFLRLNSLRVSNNLLAGELPLVIGTYPELSVVDLSNNHLYGSLPRSLFTSFRLTYLNLSGNHFTGPIPIPSSKRSILMSSDTLVFTFNSSLLSLDLSDNSLSGPLPQGIRSLNRLKLLKIEGNNISGQIPQEVGSLDELLFLDLSNNHLVGTIPDNLPAGLIGFNVSFNDLHGIIPDNLLRFADSSFHPGNTQLAFPPGFSNGSGFRSNGTHIHRMKTLLRYLLIAGVVGTAAVLILLSVLIYIKSSNGKKQREGTAEQKFPPTLSPGIQKSTDMPPASQSLSPGHADTLPGISESMDHGIIESITKRQQITTASSNSPAKMEGKSPKSFILSPSNFCDPQLAEQPPVLRVCSPDKLAGDLHLFDNSFVFTAEELSRAPAEIIGRSCHGTSYKATLDSEHVVTVKWLREGISKGKKDFSREAKKLCNIKHPNIVSLRGYYWGPKEHERLIISDHINAVSLAVYLCEFGPRELSPLSLSKRLSIAVDVARCLNYLHNEKAIPHGNLKSTNIILQLPELHALLTDYSLHRIMNPAGMAEQVLNAGALGYRPPEFANTSKPCPSLKSDVYAFGVILLELLTGKSAGEIVSSNPGVVDLTDWVKSLASENRTYECFDRVVPGVDSAEGPPELLENMLRIALRCIRSASERPEIKTVFEDLSSIAVSSS